MTTDISLTGHKIRFRLNDTKAIDMDVVAAEMSIERIVENLTPNTSPLQQNEELVNQFAVMVQREHDIELDPGQAWMAIQHIRHAYAHFKKKLDDDLGLDTGTDSTHGTSPTPTSKNSADNSPNS